jgi:uncharacterized phage-associated protein
MNGRTEKLRDMTHNEKPWLDHEDDELASYFKTGLRRSSKYQIACLDDTKW